jgi:hypothetical protein
MTNKCKVLNYKENTTEKKELHATDSIRAKSEDSILSNVTAGKVLYSTAKRTLHDINLLKTKRNLLYIRNQSVPHSKHFPPRL